MHVDATFAACAAFSYEVAPNFQTRIVTRRNRRESRNAELAQVFHDVSIPFQNITKTDVLDIKRLFLVCRGPVHTFYFKDPADFEAVDEIFGVGDGATKDFQLRKVYEADGQSYEREIYLPVGAVITDNHAAAGANTVDLETGEVNFTVAPVAGHVLRWSGQHRLKVRFASDRLPFTIDNKSRGEFRMNGSVDLLEVPE